MDRITQIGIQNVRAIESVTLDLGEPMTVLIGENGSAKSTIIECLELLRKAADSSFSQQFYHIHRGMPGLLRKGATQLTLSIKIEDTSAQLAPLIYGFTLGTTGFSTVVVEENLKVGWHNPDSANSRTIDAAIDWRQLALPVQPDRLMLNDPLVERLHPEAQRVLRILRGIEVHVGFETRASWVARSFQRPETIRSAVTHFPTDRLSLLGANLANAWSELLARPLAERDQVMDMLRLGLGDRVDTVIVKADMGGGNIYLAVRFNDLVDPVFASDLSDGQLAWLAFVAMTMLNKDRSLIAIDEPELHLHPWLLARVVSLLGNLPGAVPVILSTHSDRVLEMLDDPADAIRVCRMNGNKATVHRLDPAVLPHWLEQYEDIGQLRSAGYLDRVVAGVH